MVRGTRASSRRVTQAEAADVDELVTAVLTASRVLVGVSARSLAELEGSLTIPQFRTLVVLERHDGINLNGLSDELGVNASTALRMVDRLLAAGMVTRVENPANRREVLLGLTTAARTLVADVTRRRRAEIATIVSAMPAERRGALVAALHAFADAADEPTAGADGLGW